VIRLSEVTLSLEKAPDFIIFKNRYGNRSITCPHHTAQLFDSSISRARHSRRSNSIAIKGNKNHESGRGDCRGNDARKALRRDCVTVTASFPQKNHLLYCDTWRRITRDPDARFSRPLPFNIFILPRLPHSVASLCLFLCPSSSRHFDSSSRDCRGMLRVLSEITHQARK
jgi:hypothetical protein